MQKRAYIAGILPLKIDSENTNFWLTYQDEDLKGDRKQLQFKQQELENMTYCNKLSKSLVKFVE